MAIIIPKTQQDIIDVLYSVENTFNLRNTDPFLISSLNIVEQSMYASKYVSHRVDIEDTVIYMDVDKSTGLICRKCFYVFNNDGTQYLDQHRGNDLPQYIGYNENGIVIRKNWKIFNKAIRNNISKPIEIVYYEKRGVFYKEIDYSQEHKNENNSLLLSDILIIDNKITEVNYMINKKNITFKNIQSVLPHLSISKIYEFKKLPAMLTQDEISLLEIVAI